MEYDLPSLSQRLLHHRSSILRILRVFKKFSTGDFQVLWKLSPGRPAADPRGALSPWLPTGNSRWVTWRASHLLSTPSPSTPWEATPPLTCWPTAACLGDLALTCPKRWPLSVSNFHYCLTFPPSHVSFSIAAQTTYMDPYLNFSQVTLNNLDLPWKEENTAI